MKLVMCFLIAMNQFHFKSMLHPHNVRKRIKQLKDYINVTPGRVPSQRLLYSVIDRFVGY